VDFHDGLFGFVNSFCWGLLMKNRALARQVAKAQNLEVPSLEIHHLVIS